MALLKTSWHIDCLAGLAGLILSRFQNSTVPLNQRGSKVFKRKMMTEVLHEHDGQAEVSRPSSCYEPNELDVDLCSGLI